MVLLDQLPYKVLLRILEYVILPQDFSGAYLQEEETKDEDVFQIMPPEFLVPYGSIPLYNVSKFFEQLVGNGLWSTGNWKEASSLENGTNRSGKVYRFSLRHLRYVKWLRVDRNYRLTQTVLERRWCPKVERVVFNADAGNHTQMVQFLDANQDVKVTLKIIDEIPLFNGDPEYYTKLFRNVDFLMFRGIGLTAATLDLPFYKHLFSIRNQFKGLLISAGSVIQYSSAFTNLKKVAEILISNNSKSLRYIDLTGLKTLLFDNNSLDINVPTLANLCTIKCMALSLPLLQSTPNQCISRAYIELPDSFNMDYLSTVFSNSLTTVESITFTGPFHAFKMLLPHFFTKLHSNGRVTTALRSLHLPSIPLSDLFDIATYLKTLLFVSFNYSNASSNASSNAYGNIDNYGFNKGAIIDYKFSISQLLSTILEGNKCTRVIHFCLNGQDRISIASLYNALIDNSVILQIRVQVKVPYMPGLNVTDLFSDLPYSMSFQIAQLCEPVYEIPNLCCSEVYKRSPNHCPQLFIQEIVIHTQRLRYFFALYT